jgi:hypothetical protein
MQTQIHLSKRLCKFSRQNERLLVRSCLQEEGIRDRFWSWNMIVPLLQMLSYTNGLLYWAMHSAYCQFRGELIHPCSLYTNPSSLGLNPLWQCRWEKRMLVITGPHAHGLKDALWTLPGSASRSACQPSLQPCR